MPPLGCLQTNTGTARGGATISRQALMRFTPRAFCRVRGPLCADGFQLNRLYKPHANKLGYALLFHGDAIEIVGGFHCALAMGDDNELRRCGIGF